MPVSAFITFLEEDPKKFAVNYQGFKQLLGKELRFKQASEPTDIIWENRHTTKNMSIMKQMMAYIIILILLLGSFLLVFMVARYSTGIASTYAPVNCNTIVLDYGD